jgi:drug/metabolite transporter (DMT)-like permease
VIYGWLALLLLLWSTNFIFVKFALRELPVPLILGFRYIFSAVCMLPLLPRLRRPKNLSRVLIVGLLGLVGNQVVFTIGISMTSVAHAGIITALSPVLVLIGSAIAGDERVTPLRLTGVVTAGLGVILLQFSRGGTGGATPKGDAIMLLSVLLFAAFNLWGKPVAESIGSLQFNAISYFAAGVIAIPVALGNLKTGAHASVLAWSGVVYMALGSSVAGYLIYAYALRKLPASRVATVLYLQPLLASLLAVLILGERPGIAFLPAAALVITGVYIVERQPILLRKLRSQSPL